MKVSVIDRKTWNDSAEGELVVLACNNWYDTDMCKRKKLLRNNYTKKNWMYNVCDYLTSRYELL